MIYADDIRKTILKVAEERGLNKTFETADVAQKIDRENWMSIMQQVNLVADTLIKEGKIDIETSDGSVRYKKI
jgi:hypothetical protein